MHANDDYNSPLNKALRARDDDWRAEIEKHLPQLRVMSFAGPVSVIPWLFEHVDIKPEDAKLANALKAIQSDQNLTDEQKRHARLITIFPGLRGENE